MPDAKTMGRWGVAVGPEAIKQIHNRIVQIARDHRVAEGRRMRVDTTVVETNIHYPTDSSLLGDGVRVLTRTMKKITGIAGGAGAKLRDRSRSVKLRVLEIARAARAKGRQSGEKLVQSYRRLLQATGRVVGQARRFAKQIDDGVKRAADIPRQAALDGLRRELQSMVPRVQQVMRQTKARRLRRRYPRRGQNRRPVRAYDRGHSQSLPSRKRGARPASQPNSAKWSNCRKRRTRSSSPTRSTTSGPVTRTC
jgi:IS5 family transposase